MDVSFFLTFSMYTALALFWRTSTTASASMAMTVDSNSKFKLTVSLPVMVTCSSFELYAMNRPMTVYVPGAKPERV